MAKRSTISQLPENVRREFELKLAQNGFADYTALTEWLNGQGYEISRSAVHRYGKQVQERFESIKATTEAARLIAEGAADDDDSRTAAIMGLMQEELFNLLIEMKKISREELPTLARFELMTEASRKVSSFSQASTRLKEYQAKVKDKMAAKFAELEAESAKQDSGLDTDTLQRIRREVYGVMS